MVSLKLYWNPCSLKWLRFNLINVCLTLSWQRPLSYRNQFIDLLCKSMDWFLYDNGLRHERVKCRPCCLRCLLLMFLLSITSMLRFNKWFTNWDTVKVAFPLSVLSVRNDNQTLHWGSFSLTKDFNFNKLFWISLDVELGTPFVPICIIILGGFFRVIGIIWWLKSSKASWENV